MNDPKSKCPPSGMVGGGRGERPRTTISFEQVQISKNSERILVIICILHRGPDDNDMSVEEFDEIILTNKYKVSGQHKLGIIYVGLNEFHKFYLYINYYII